MIYIPPGSSRHVRSLGCFAVIWLAIVGGISAAAIFGGTNGGLADAFLLTLFFALFWAVGLFMLYFWMRGRFGKTVLLVEPDRLVKKFELFGREKYREYSLCGSTRATLVEAYRQNNRPVYAIAVSTAARPAKFGTFLSQEEKDWLVEQINEHLKGNGRFRMN